MRSDERQRLEELLPFYLNNTLSDSDRMFVQDVLRRQPGLSNSVFFNECVQRGIKALGSEQVPDPARINRLIARWNESSQSRRSAQVRDSWFSRLLLAIPSMGVAAVAASLVVGVGALPLGILHGDTWDGMADLRLSLASGIDPDHEVVLANLERHDGVIVNQSQQDGRYLIYVDLRNRAASQHNLIRSLQASGHIDGYTLLASR